MTAGVPASSEPPASMPLTQRSFSSDQRTTTRGHILAGRIVPARNSRISGSIWSSRSAGLKRRLALELTERAALRDVRVGRRPAARRPRGALATGPSASASAEAAAGQRDAEDRGLVEVERDGVVVAVGDRAPLVLHARAEDRPTAPGAGASRRS